MNHSQRHDVRCAHCRGRDADHYLVTSVHPTKHADAVTKKAYLCGPCTEEGVRWMAQIGLQVTYRLKSNSWNALVQKIDPADDQNQTRPPEKREPWKNNQTLPDTDP